LAGLDFRSAAALFMGTQREFAMALRITPEQVGRYCASPDDAPAPLLQAMGRVLVERGRGMARVGEMLLERSAS
jgi:hypothetical protein